REGWLVEIGKDGNTTVLRCCVPGQASPPVTESVTTSDGDRHHGLHSPSPPVTESVTTSDGDRHHGLHSPSPPVTESVTTSDGPYKEESGQGIRSGNPSSEQQQQQAGAKDRGEMREPSDGSPSVPAPRYPFDAA